MKNKEVIAVDLGGTNLRVSLVRGSEILEYRRVPTPRTKNTLIKCVFELISEFIEKKSGNVSGIGIGSPGPLVNGVIKFTPNLPLKNFDLRGAAEKRFRVRVEVENDANCVALAEAKLGVQKKNFFILTLGTGIGGGVIIDGGLYDKGGCGTELGHIYLTPKKDFEALAGMKAINEMSYKAFGRKMFVSELIKLKDVRARRILDGLGEYLGQGIGSLINVFNPEIVVLAGGMRAGGDEFLKIIREKTKKYIFLPGKFDIEWTKLEHPGTLGAALLID